MQGQTTVQEVAAQRGDQQGADAAVRRREPLQVSLCSSSEHNNTALFGS